jgi:hypothetical protein
MPDRDDRSYYRTRARQERALALACEDNAAAVAHLNLAEAYEQRAMHSDTVHSATSFPIMISKI